MTKIKYLISLIALLVAVQARAQSNAIVSVPGFASSVQEYFTQFNTNYSWTNVTIEVATGYKQVNGANAASDFTAQYDIGKFNVGVALQFSGIASAVNGAEAQFGYTILEKYDTKLDADLRAGWDDTKLDGSGKRGAFEVEPALFLSKKLTINTFARTGISFPVYSVGRFNSQPTGYLEMGFTY